MGRAGSLYLIFIGLLFCAVGGVFTWLMWRSYDRAASQRDWIETDCIIIESRVAERRIGVEVDPEYRFAVLYGYEFGGKRHTSERYSLQGSAWSGTPEKAERFVEDFPAGSAAVCYVDPSDPGSAVLKRDSKGPGYSLWFPLLIVAGGLGIIAGALRGMFRPGPQSGERGADSGRGIVEE